MLFKTYLFTQRTMKNRNKNKTSHLRCLHLHKDNKYGVFQLKSNEETNHNKLLALKVTSLTTLNSTIVKFSEKWEILK